MEKDTVVIDKIDIENGEKVKPHILNRIIGAVIDACLVFMVFFGFYILFMNTSISDSYHEYSDEVTVIYDSTLYETGMGYKKFDFKDNEIYGSYRVYEESDGTEFIIVNIPSPKEDAPTEEWDAYTAKYLEFTSKIENNAAYSAAKTNMLLTEFGLVSLSAFISEGILLLAIPLIDKKRRTLGKIFAKTELYSTKHLGVAKWHQVVGSFLFKLIVESIIPFIFLKHTTAFAIAFIELVFMLCNRENRSFHELVSRTKVVINEFNIQTKK